MRQGSGPVAATFSEPERSAANFQAAGAGNRRGLPHHHLPALHPLDPNISVAAVEQFGFALDAHVQLRVARHDNHLAVDLYVLDWALALQI